jgi:hypothetical protein
MPRSRNSKKEKSAGRNSGLRVSAVKLNWHTAFFQAIQRELADYKDALEFRCEYQLTAESLRIDMVIINNLALKGRGCCSYKVFVFGV